MIVPTIRIVIGDDNRGICPETRLLDGIDGIDYELLFQYGIGIGGMTVLVTRCFQETDGRQVISIKRIKKVVDIVLVVGDGIRAGSILAWGNCRPRMA